VASKHVFLYCNYGIVSVMVCCGFWRVFQPILLFVALVEILRLQMFFIVYEDFGCL
jgi:hypothetical protein